MLGMTPAQTRANGLGNPSLPQLWLTAMLRMLVELVRNVASTFQMRWLRPKRDWHTPDDEAALPRVKTDTHQEANTAAQHRSPIALILSSAQSARQSKHEGVLATVSHASPSPSVSHATRAIHLPLLCRWRQTALRRLRLRGIASTAFGGGGGLRALARKTEGASHKHRRDTVNHVHAISAEPHPSLRVRRFASNPRRKSGPGASRVIYVESGPQQQPCIPACAGTSGESLTSSNKNAAA